MTDKRVFALPRRLIRKYGTRDPFEIAEALDISIIMCSTFKRQKGAFKVIAKNGFIFINSNLSDLV